MEALVARLNLDKLNNSLASRKTNYRKNAKKHGVSYEDYVMSKCGISLEKFESVEYSLPKRAASGNAPVKGTPEFSEYKRRASRKTYTKRLLEYVTACDESCTTVEQFVAKHTGAGNVEEFYSDEYNKSNKGCYNVKAYAFMSVFH
tara:strand:- start:549 stop:986 length:438 start_codon:yes stop_codon:yes gene_type:complete